MSVKNGGDNILVALKVLLESRRQDRRDQHFPSVWPAVEGVHLVLSSVAFSQNVSGVELPLHELHKHPLPLCCYVVLHNFCPDTFTVSFKRQAIEDDDDKGF